MQCLDGKLRVEDKLGVCWALGAPFLTATDPVLHTRLQWGYGKEAAHTQVHSYHVGVRTPWQPLTRVQMKELVDLGGGQSVSDL